MSAPDRHASPGRPPSESRRRKLVWDSVLGFVGFLCLLAVMQAVINVLRPQPAVWPALFALVMLAVTWLLWRFAPRD